MPRSRSILDPRPALLCAALCAHSGPGIAAAPADWDDLAQPTLPGAAAGMDEMLLEVLVNRQPNSEPTLILRDRAGALYAGSADLLRWRLHAPADDRVVRHLGLPYRPLAALAGVNTMLDVVGQRLLIEAAPSAFFATAMSEAAAAPPQPQRSGSGGFFNYELFAQRAARRSSGAGLVEFGVFNTLGVGTSTFLADRSAMRRLDTTWTVDLPERRSSFRIGDAVTRAASSWGRSTRFGGIQYATNFATQPYTLTLPLQQVSGEAVLPSTVDIFVNNALVSSQAVPPGPFSINDLPGVTGLGQMRVVVRDLFGREQVVTQPFYASASLLRSGLNDFSFEAGWIRTHYAQAGSQYGRRFGAGTYRHGLSDQLTAEAHAEVAEGGQSSAGLAAVQLVPALGVFNAATAASRTSAGSGGLLGLGFERSSVSGLSFGLRSQWASSRFAQIGQDSDGVPRLLVSATASVFAGSVGSLGVGYVRQDPRERERAEFVSAHYGRNLGRTYLGLSLLQALTGERAQSLFASLTIPFGENTSASVSAQRSSSGAQHSQELSTQAQQSLPAGSGWGWRVAASSQQRYEAGLAWQNDASTWYADVARSAGQSAARASVSGGLAFIGGTLFAGRRIDDSFGIVQLPDYPGVRVFADNQPVARIDAQGNAFLPRLRAYERNSIGIDAADFPLDAQIDALKIDAVPYHRSGLVLKFPVRRSAGALVRLLLDDGGPVPAGAVVRVAGNEAEFPVALDGEAWLTGLAASNTLRVSWRGISCAIMLDMKASDDPLPRLGPFVCSGVPR